MEWIYNMQARLLTDLPGWLAQSKMAPPIRTANMPIPENVRLGGVMILLMEHEGKWHTVLIRRTEDGHTHSGQISFPGGKKDRQDEHLTATALRECDEEIGVPANAVEIIGNLSPLYIPPSNFLVTPTVAWLKTPWRFRPSEREVQEIIQVPLDLLFDPAIKKVKEVKRSDLKNIGMHTPVYALDKDIMIWGATAMIIAELESLLIEEDLGFTFTVNKSIIK